MAEYQTDNLVQSVIADGDTGKSLKINPDSSINVVSSDSGGSLSSVYDTTNTEAQILSMGTISPTGAIMSKFTVALKCTHATNGVSYRVTNFFGLLELDTNSGNLNPNQSVIIDINRPLLGVNVYAKNKNTGSNSQITATLIGRV